MGTYEGRKVSFSKSGGLYSLLKERVDEHFARTGRQKTGDWRLYLKTATILALLAGSYVLLVFVPLPLWAVIVTGFVLAQSMALVGFNIMHDGNHESYSANPLVNRLMGFMLDLIGGSSFLWRQKHNILHHTYTNIRDLDEDIETSGILRLSPEQDRSPLHRFQHWYALPVYSLLTLSWIAYSDFHKFFTGRVGTSRIPRPGPIGSVLFFVTKALYLVLALVVPTLYHPFWQVLIAFIGIHLVLGFTLSIVFQLAHTVPGNAFPTPDSETGKIASEWAIHQLETTADFARGSRLAAWYLGGLNFQIEHHLFPRVSHVHYPAISEIVERTAAENDVKFLAFPSVLAAVRAHLRHLKTLGTAS